ncbi:MAG TPA: endo alpha-1,4 polygalactosaminidase [Acidimicrobiia bacterium]|nr:endo alpha-1,4 polygalactosaminidase [Acidimicrobiia bacterium]
MHRAVLLLLPVLTLVTACSSERSVSTTHDTDAGTNRWQPAADVTWQWQLQGELDTTYAVDVYDVDLIDTDADVIASLHDAGRRVVCYFSAGTWESFRDDADAISPGALGAPVEGFEDERWVDVRDESVRGLVDDRLDLALEKGCDAVEPDNVDGWDNDTELDFDADDQLDFNRFLADAAHERGLAVGLKNDLDQIPELVDDFDFAVNEQCHEFDECDLVTPFLDAGKPVFNAEYATELIDNPDGVCREAVRRDLRTLLVPLDLDNEFRISCDDG